MFKRTAVPPVGPSEHQARQPLNMALALFGKIPKGLFLCAWINSRVRRFATNQDPPLIAESGKKRRDRMVVAYVARSDRGVAEERLDRTVVAGDARPDRRVGEEEHRMVVADVARPDRRVGEEERRMVVADVARPDR